MTYQGIIFDLDGTLLDTLDDMADSVNQVLTTMNFPVRSKSEISSFIGYGVKYFLGRSLPTGSDEVLITQAVTIYQNTYKQNMFNKTHPFDGIPQLLNRLSSLRMKMAILSNKPDADVKALCDLHFRCLFELTRGDLPGVPRKPAPDSTLQILQEMGTSPSQTLYVGDSEVDMQTAHNAGLPAVGVTWGLRSEEVLQQAGAFHIIHTPTELMALFEET